MSLRTGIPALLMKHPTDARRRSPSAAGSKEPRAASSFWVVVCGAGCSPNSPKGDSSWGFASVRRGARIALLALASAYLLACGGGQSGTDELRAMTGDAPDGGADAGALQPSLDESSAMTSDSADPSGTEAADPSGSTDDPTTDDDARDAGVPQANGSPPQDAASAHVDAAASGGPAPDAATPSDIAPTESLMLSDANGIIILTSLYVPTEGIGRTTDLAVCWEAGLSNLLCADAQLDQLTLTYFQDLSQSAVIERIRASDLSRGESTQQWSVSIADNTSSCALLSDLAPLGGSADLSEHLNEDANGVYLLTLSQGEAPQGPPHWAGFLEPNEIDLPDSIYVEAGCGQLEMQASLGTATPIQLADATAQWLVDWSSVNVNASSEDLQSSLVDSVRLRFVPADSLNQVQDFYPNSALLATELYELAFAQPRTSLALSELIDASTGKNFHGFDSDEAGTWLLELGCEGCLQPLFISVIEPLE